MPFMQVHGFVSIYLRLSHATLQQHLLMTCSTGYRKIGFINYSNKNVNLSYSTYCGDLSYLFQKCTLFGIRILLKNQFGGLLSVHRRLYLGCAS